MNPGTRRSKRIAKKEAAARTSIIALVSSSPPKKHPLQQRGREQKEARPKTHAGESLKSGDPDVIDLCSLSPPPKNFGSHSTRTKKSSSSDDSFDDESTESALSSDNVSIHESEEDFWDDSKSNNEFLWQKAMLNDVAENVQQKKMTSSPPSTKKPAASPPYLRNEAQLQDSSASSPKKPNVKSPPKPQQGKLQSALERANKKCSALANRSGDAKLVYDNEREAQEERLAKKEKVEPKLRAYLDEMRLELEGAALKNEELEAAREEMRGKLDAKEEEAENLQKELEVVSRDASTKKKLLEATKDKMGSQLESLERTLAAKEEEAGNLQKDLENAHTSLKDASAKSEELSVQLNAAHTLGVENSSRLDEITKQKEVTSEQLGSKIAALESRLQELRRDYDAKTAEVEHLEIELEAARGSLRNKLETDESVLLAETVAAREVEAENLRKELGGLETSLKNALAWSEELSLQLNEMHTLDSRMSAKLDEMTKQKEAVSEKLVLLEADLLESKRDRDALHSAAATLTKERDELAIQLCELKQKRDIHIAVIKSSNMEKECLSEQNTHQAAELSEVRDRCNSLQNQLRSLSETSAAEKSQFGDRVKILESNKQVVLIENDKKQRQQIKELIQMVADIKFELEKSDSECTSLSENCLELKCETDEQCEQTL